MEENSKYKAIDLGLPSGTKWANMNIGANSETENGDYFAWGETEPYYVNWTDRSTNPTQWVADGNYNFTPYGAYPYVNSDGIEVTGIAQPYDVDTLILNSDCDVATMKMGESWKMPTLEQLEELLTLQNEWVENYLGTGVNGRLFQGKDSGEGNTLFLPASGDFGEGSLGGLGGNGYLWGSSRNEVNEDGAYYLGFYSSRAYIGIHGRCVGLAVRGIC